MATCHWPQGLSILGIQNFDSDSRISGAEIRRWGTSDEETGAHGEYERFFGIGLMWQLVQRTSTDIARTIPFARCIVCGYVRHGS